MSERQVEFCLNGFKYPHLRILRILISKTQLKFCLVIQIWRRKFQILKISLNTICLSTLTFKQIVCEEILRI